MADRTRAHVLVSGRVQGVYYRATTRETAERLGVDGWVQNLDDGRFEAVFEGPADAVGRMIGWCHEGSPDARVERVEEEYEEPENSTGSRSGGRSSSGSVACSDGNNPSDVFTS